jgi:hypothetical protein
MRLTNYIRDAFVRAALADVPQVDYEEALRSAVVKDAVAQLPPKVRSVYTDANTRHFLECTTWYPRNETGRRRVDVSAMIPWPDDSFKLSEAGQAKVDEIIARLKGQQDAHESLERQLRAVAYSVQTRKALVEALPEFEKYLPADDAAALRTVPAIANVVAEFMKAGWPKDGAARCG